MRVVRIVVAALSVAVAAPAFGDEAQSAAGWLERMAGSLAALNYEGVFTHSTGGGQSETMRIIHRVEDGRSQERLVSLDGSGREIVRTREEVHFYMPDRRVVLVEPRSDGGSLLKALPTPGPKLEALYALDARGGQKLLGRDVRAIEIRPRDAYRYGYRLWLDEETAMPLRSEVVDRDGKAVEAIHFTRLEVRERIPAQRLEPAVDATGFQWIRTGRRTGLKGAGGSWRPGKMPPGFRLVGTRTQMLPDQPVPVQHLIFSDGFASVSVFIEPGADRGPAPPEATRVGSAHTFSTQVQGHTVTAVGEVPAATLRDIATSLAPVAGEVPAGPADAPRDR